MDTARIDPRRLLAFLGASALGLVLVLGGLGWDIAMHAADPRLAEHESVFTLSNPSHAMFAAGLVVLAAGIIGSILTVTATRPEGSLLRRRSVRAGVAAGAATLILAAGGLGAWAQSAMDSHGHTEAAAGDGHATSDKAGHSRGHDATQQGSGAHGHRLTSEDIAAATPQQRAAARKLLADTIAATLAYRDADAAEAAGYKFVIKDKALVQHIPNPAYNRDGKILDPQRPESLLYIKNPNTGELALVGVVYRMPRPSMTGPKPGGPITSWHTHAKCVDPDGSASRPASRGTCPAGMEKRTGVERMHVWFTDDILTAFSSKIPFRAVMTYQQQLATA